MKHLMTTSLLIAAMALPSLAQTNAPSTTGKLPAAEQQNAPGQGGTSKPGVPGVPGIKSGPADKSSSGAGAGVTGKTTPSQGAAGSDESKVPGLPGNKSGPAEKAPSK